jgi:hypothetical protein
VLWVVGGVFFSGARVHKHTIKIHFFGDIKKKERKAPLKMSSF